MGFVTKGIADALRIIVSGDGEFLEIVFVSLKIAATSTALATLLGVAFGVLVALKSFRGRGIVITTLNTLMSLPTVVVGLFVYSLISRQGLFGSHGLLFTQTAMVIGQLILAFPIVAGLTVSAMRSLDPRVSTTLDSLGASAPQRFLMLIREARFGLGAAVVAGFGRVFAEVGVSMMLGGNIHGYTRNITTAIALETSKGEFALGFALGIVLLFTALLINVLFGLLQRKDV